MPADVRDAATALAVDTLWALTGRRFNGPCPITVRPCRPDEDCRLSTFERVYWNPRGYGQMGVTMGSGFVPTIVAGEVFNLACGCQNTCTCRATCEVFLPGPVCSVTEVKLDGEVIDPEQYYVLDYTKLVVKYLWVPSTKAGRLVATAAPYDLGDRWTYNPEPTGGTNRTEYPGPQWGPTNVFDAYYQIFPTLPDGVLQLTYDPAAAPESIAIAPVVGGACAYEWDSTVYPNGTVLAVGDSITTSSIAFCGDGDDGSRYTLTVTSGTATVTSARAMELSEDFAATVRFEERTNGCFPCQNYNLDDTEPGTWSVTYLRGEEVPLAGQISAGILACEIAKAMLGEACGLSAGASKVIREGITIELPDAADIAVDGRTGIAVVDRWIHSVNPAGLAQPPYVWSPDTTTVRRRTWP
jgi:hypothetical protein